MENRAKTSVILPFSARNEARVRIRIGHLEIAVRARSAGVNDALWNSLVIEMGDLLAERKIFQKRRTSAPGFQRILIVRDDALIGRERCLSRLSGFDAWRLPDQRRDISQDR